MTSKLKELPKFKKSENQQQKPTTKRLIKKKKKKKKKKKYNIWKKISVVITFIYCKIVILHTPVCFVH